MARLRKVNLSTLPPDKLQFWQGMRRAPGLGPDDMLMRVPAKWNPRKPWRTRSHGGKGWPDESIKTLALTAAEWLREHWPHAAQAEGADQFLVNRYNEILAGLFPPKYWDPCPLNEETTRIGYPNCEVTLKQPPTHLADPDSENMKCTYSTTEPHAGHAAFAGATLPPGRFNDLYLAEKHFLFDLPEPTQPVGVRPLFSLHNATWYVQIKYHNHQPWCSLYKSSTAAAADDLVDRNQSVDVIGRYFYWQYKIPPSTAVATEQTMNRRFIVDALYLSSDYGLDPDKAGVCLIQSAPASARGTYRYGNRTLSTIQHQVVDLYRARVEDDDLPLPTLNGFIFIVDSGDTWAYRCKDASLPLYTSTIEAYYPAKTELDRSITRQLWWHWNKQHPDDKIPPFPSTVYRVAQTYISPTVRGGPLRVNGTKPLWTSTPELVFASGRPTSPYNGCGDWHRDYISKLSNCEMLGGSVNYGFMYAAGTTGFAFLKSPGTYAPAGQKYLVTFGTDRFYIRCLWLVGSTPYEYRLDNEGKPAIFDANGFKTVLPNPPA